MDTLKIQSTVYKPLLSGVALVAFLILYSLRSADLPEGDDEETSVSLCQVHVQYLGLDGYEDRTLLLLLAQLKMNDFLIGQPVWGPSETLLYLCEHRLKTGLKQSKLERELHRVLKANPVASARFAWTCV